MATLRLSHREQSQLLGPHRSLLTFVTHPSESKEDDGPVVVFLNTGIVHRIGHNRMYVTLARMLAARGCMAVRFDFSGIGDSPPRRDGTTPLEAAMHDIRVVLDWVESTSGVTQVVLVGLCAGADSAVLYCNSDPRIVGLVLLDPSVPRTLRYYYHYVLQRLGNPRSWLSVLRGRSGLLNLIQQDLKRDGKRASGLHGLTMQELAFSPYLNQCYKHAAVRKVRLLTVFTSVSARHSYHQQILDAFPEAASGGSLRLEYFAESDHLFSQPQTRARLYRVIIEWLGLK